MSHSHSPDAVAKHLKVYILVFIALLVGTVITVGMYYVHLQTIALTVAVALIIASTKASLVAAYFMHLASEKKSIYTVLAVTGFFFLGLMGLTLWAMHDFPEGTEHQQGPPVFSSRKPCPLKPSISCLSAPRSSWPSGSASGR